jgi:hypothetical protein
MRNFESQARSRLCAFLLRHNQRYGSVKSKWIQAYWRWLERIKFPHPVQQVVFQEYIDSVKPQQQRVVDFEQSMHEALTDWTLAPVACLM